VEVFLKASLILTSEPILKALVAALIVIENGAGLS
jgi:hypothetical protein